MRHVAFAYEHVNSLFGTMDNSTKEFLGEIIITDCKVWYIGSRTINRGVSLDVQGIGDVKISLATL